MLTVNNVQYEDITKAIVEHHTQYNHTFAWLTESIETYRVTEGVNDEDPPTYEYSPTDEQILEAHNRILEVTGISVDVPISILGTAKIAAVKKIANEKILAIATDIEQRNILARAFELLDIPVGDRTAPEATEVTNLKATWASIKAVRSASDLIEVEITSDSAYDHIGSPLWP